MDYDNLNYNKKRTTEAMVRFVCLCNCFDKKSYFFLVVVFFAVVFLAVVFFAVVVFFVVVAFFVVVGVVATTGGV